MKYSFNPYNVNRLSMVPAPPRWRTRTHFRSLLRRHLPNRAWTRAAESAGLYRAALPGQLPLCQSHRIGGEELYRPLKENGILVRWFDAPASGTMSASPSALEQMETLMDRIDRLLDACKKGGPLCALH